jgi:AP-3 complex subunit delta-1
VRAIFDVVYRNLATAPSDSDSPYASPENVPSVLVELPSLFSLEFNPVAPKAQKKVPVPEGLDLDTWINEPLPESESTESEDEEESYGYGYGQKFGGSSDLVFPSGNGSAVGRRRGRKGRRKSSESVQSDLKQEQVEYMQKRVAKIAERCLLTWISLFVEAST